MTEYETASDLEFKDNMSRPKSRGNLSKKERQKEKNFRDNRKNARGRKWQGGE